MSRVKTTIASIAMFSLVGCAGNDAARWITDSEQYWEMSGFSVKPPSGSRWMKTPADNKTPNMIRFAKIDPKSFALNPNEPSFDGTVVIAVSGVFDEHVSGGKDMDAFSKTIREYNDRYHVFGDSKIDQLSYDRSFGLDCLRYKLLPSKEKFKSSLGDIYFKEANGYFCLHPEYDNFGVFMAGVNAARTGFNLPNRDDQVEHLFSSLRFQQLSSPVRRTFSTQAFPVGKTPYQVTLYQGMIWAAIKDDNKVVRVDPSNGKILDTIVVGGQPVSIASGEKGIWIANSGDGTVTRIDPATSTVTATIPVTGKLESITVGRGGVWVANSTGNSIVRIDPAKNAVVATITVGREPVSVNAGKDGIWSANAGDGTVSLIDPAYDWPINTIQVGGRPIRVSLANGSAWVADEAHNLVVRIERKTRTVTAKIDVGTKPSWIYSIGGGDVFVALSDAAKIVRIDPASNRIFGPPMRSEPMPKSMVHIGRTLWVANSGGHTLSKIDFNPLGLILNNTSAEIHQNTAASR